MDNLALNQAAQKRNVLRGIEQVDEPTAGVEQLRRGLTGSHGRTVRRRPSRRNLLSAQKLSDYGNFELEHQAEIARLFTRLDHSTDDRQVDRRK